MVLYLTGILEDGSSRAAGVPLVAATPIILHRGETTQVRVQIIRPSGQLVNLAQVASDITLTVKRFIVQQPPSLMRVGVMASSGATFEIEAGAMRQMQPGQYLYDVWLTLLDGTSHQVVLTSTLMLEAAVKSPPWTPPPPTLDLVEGDTDPLILDFSGADITGWVVTMRVAYAIPLVKTAALTDPAHGIAEVQWSPTDLVPGLWPAEVTITKPGPVIKTTDVLLLRVRAHV